MQLRQDVRPQPAALVLARFDIAMRAAALASSLVAPPLAADALLRLLHQHDLAAPRPPMLNEALDELRATLFSAAGRDDEMQRLWTHALATAAGAWHLARACAPPPEAAPLAGAAALAGLLHRVGHARVLAVIAHSEAATGQHLHATQRRRLQSAHEAPLRDVLLSVWALPASVSLAVRQWPDALEPQACELARCIYLARLLVTEQRQPHWCPPAMLTTVARQLQITATALHVARAAVSAVG